MANHEVAKAVHATLSADTVDVVTLTQDHPNVEILNRGEADIFARVGRADTSAPTVLGNDCLIIPPAGSLIVSLPTTPGVRDVVKLIATDACAYSVTGASR